MTDPTPPGTKPGDAPDAIASQIGWTGASNGLAGVGDAGLFILVIGAVVVAMRFVVRAFVRTVWAPIRD